MSDEFEKESRFGDESKDALIEFFNTDTSLDDFRTVRITWQAAIEWHREYLWQLALSKYLLEEECVLTLDEIRDGRVR